MNHPPFHIIRYRKSYEPQLMELENEAVQGRMIQLRMIRGDFKSRSDIFENHRIYLSLSDQGELQGVAAGAILPVGINGQIHSGGFGYDLRVRKAWRRMGLATEFGRQLVDDYFRPNQTSIYFTTSKKDNVAVYKAALGQQQDWADIPYSYLTIPTGTRFRSMKRSVERTRCSVSLLSNQGKLTKYYTRTQEGIGLWFTNHVYSLQIVRIHPAVRIWARARNLARGSGVVLPGTGEELKFATAFDLTPTNLGAFPQAMEYLARQGVHFCNVICGEGDFKYRALKKYAINTYEYILINSSGYTRDDTLKMDVRCL